MSTLWTPSGEHRPEEPEPDPGAGAGPEFEGAGYEGGGFDYDPSSGEEPSPEQIEEMLRSRAELASVPVTDIIANHAVGLWQLAVLHLMPDPDPEGLPAPTPTRRGPAGDRRPRGPGRGPGRPARAPRRDAA